MAVFSTTDIHYEAAGHKQFLSLRMSMTLLSMYQLYITIKTLQYKNHREKLE